MEIKEVIEKYGDVELSFSCYCKYSFTYTAELKDGTRIVGDYGGDASDIYRYDVSKDSTVKVKDFENNLNSLTIIKDGEEIFSHFDY